jgi:hypothetical protein
MTNIFEKKIRKILDGQELTQYREHCNGALSFVEFWITDMAAPNTTAVSLRALKKISKLLGTKNMEVTGGNLDDDSTSVYVVAYQVEF